MSFSARRRVGAGRWHRTKLKEATPRSLKEDREGSAASADRAWPRTSEEGADGHGSSPVTIQQLAATRLVVNETSRSNCRGAQNELLAFSRDAGKWCV